MASVITEEAERTKMEKAPSSNKTVRFQLPPETITTSNADASQVPFFEIDSIGECCVSNFKNICASETWIDITEDMLIQKKILREGFGDASRPFMGQEVTMKLQGLLEDGTIVDRDPKLTFVIGDGDVIQALELCAYSMELNEIALVISDGKYAYGHLGRAPDIRADATVVYEVQLLKVRNAPDLTTLSAPDRIRRCKQKRERGNYYFQREDYHNAVRLYNQALELLNISSEINPTAEEAEELREDGLKCLNNLAAVQLKLEMHEEVITSCNAVLSLDPNNVKALFRKGKLLSEKENYEEAMETLKKALKIEPSMKAIHVELSNLVRKQTGQLDISKPKRKVWQALRKNLVPFLSSPRKSGWDIPWKWLFGAAVVAVGSVVTTVVMAARN
ncbi:FKBP prolyl isomerase 16 [Callorhinchus milii]|uniref:peptidylprolyl isomerase n=1 Tax=Callorhinchus milii TaxID=7868 RepID=A0A4W3GP19_CALMI|nr:FKBP prolyl isomerase 16 [Callorhinchus milii]|eukprot:gi/632939163/ref/XP_007907980.1/ PREDICTED: peptidyl-prolyl cis-trans isomerase FKBP8-like [Callorhinchus milii]